MNNTVNELNLHETVKNAITRFKAEVGLLHIKDFNVVNKDKDVLIVELYGVYLMNLNDVKNSDKSEDSLYDLISGELFDVIEDLTDVLKKDKNLDDSIDTVFVNFGHIDCKLIDDGKVIDVSV